MTQYPAQTGQYKVKVKNTAKWSDFDRVAFDISVGQAYHEGAKFTAAIDWANARFDTVVINVNDSLQRFNHMFDFGLSEEQARQKAVKEGDDWLQRNAASLRTVNKLQVERWENWRTRPDFKQTFDQVKSLYMQNAQFRSDINDQINSLWQRKETSENAHRKLEFFTLSRDYLLEETAIFSMMSIENKQIHAYPGSFMSIWQSFQGTDLVAGLGDFKYCRIDFSRNKSYQPKLTA